MPCHWRRHRIGNAQFQAEDSQSSRSMKLIVQPDAEDVFAHIPGDSSDSTRKGSTDVGFVEVVREMAEIDVEIFHFARPSRPSPHPRREPARQLGLDSAAERPTDFGRRVVILAAEPAKTGNKLLPTRLACTFDLAVSEAAGDVEQCGVHHIAETAANCSKPVQSVGHGEALIGDERKGC